VRHLPASCYRPRQPGPLCTQATPCSSSAPESLAPAAHNKRGSATITAVRFIGVSSLHGPSRVRTARTSSARHATARETGRVPVCTHSFWKWQRGARIEREKKKSTDRRRRRGTARYTWLAKTQQSGEARFQQLDFGLRARSLTRPCRVFLLTPTTCTLLSNIHPLPQRACSCARRRMAVRTGASNTSPSWRRTPTLTSTQCR